MARTGKYKLVRSGDWLALSGRNALVGALLTGLCSTVFAAGVCGPGSGPPPTNTLRELPLVNADDFSFIGGFALPPDTFGESSLNYAAAVIEQSGGSLFIAGHHHHDAIAEFKIPALVNSTRISDLNVAGVPEQSFSSVLDRVDNGNSQNIDTIVGMELISGKMVVNAVEYYDAPADNTHTTLVVDSADNIAGSAVRGYYELPGGAKSGGWMSELPAQWQEALGGTHLVGYSSGAAAILGRHSVGPSAHVVRGSDLIGATASQPDIPTTRLMEFSQSNPLRSDLYNESLNNDLWTMTSAAKYGFIVPGTRTYATFGDSSGYTHGLGYKITQDNGNACGGPCSRVATDGSPFYWFWDMSDLLDVMEGKRDPYDIEPYAYGEFPLPYQTNDTFHIVGGGTYDAARNRLYLSVVDANNTYGLYSNPPVIAAFRAPTR